ncbi:hypothetical protein M970_082000 [Encephalitozoon cuniculi EcunIII-L]|uniref:Uncharacterized protein n=1 Tax=Encephalitozoon cuniculi TaxID=6035 RepID=M1KB66_ENCCN|nr:hypothetical protein ECU08_2000 [Encephalitozoon cuniculi]KMV65723.1 hypothetical protein M970_082000 [Encephalitozoon cuniculi EcunIII-L]UYI27130.1 hypothetical protein J0A71_04g09820 [Encephalitozoon cuniculi]
MGDLNGRMDSLTKEIRHLSKELQNGNREIKRLEAKVREQREEIVQKDAKIEELGICISRLKRQVNKKSREVRSKERAIQSECRRKELLNGKILGSSKSRRDYYISLEMKMLNERFEIMRKFILAISERFGLDFEVFDELIRISEGFDDPVISVLLDSISPSKQMLQGQEEQDGIHLK